MWCIALSHPVEQMSTAYVWRAIRFVKAASKDNVMMVITLNWIYRLLVRAYVSTVKFQHRINSVAAKKNTHRHHCGASSPSASMSCHVVLCCVVSIKIGHDMTLFNSLLDCKPQLHIYTWTHPLYCLSSHYYPYCAVLYCTVLTVPYFCTAQFLVLWAQLQ